MREYVTYGLLLLITALLAVGQWARLSHADKWIAILLVFTFIQESIAGYLKIKYINNFFTYHIYTPIEIFLIINYFDRSVGIIEGKRIGIHIGIGAITLSIVNTLFFQRFNLINSYYLLFEGMMVIGLCMLAFYKLLIREDIVPGKMVVFWITVCFLFYWCLSYTNLGLWGASIDYSTFFAKVLGMALYYANLLFYFGLALVFIRYKKLIPSGE